VTPAVAEEGGDAAARAIEELIGDHEIERLVFFLQRADGTQRYDAFYAEGFHPIDVGAEVQLGGRNAMAAPVPREKGDLMAFELAHYIVVGRRSERCLNIYFWAMKSSSIAE
jgi:hypothetical protein